MTKRHHSETDPIPKCLIIGNSDLTQQSFFSATGRRLCILTPCVILNISVYAITPKRQIKQFPLRQFRENYCVTS